MFKPVRRYGKSARTIPKSERLFAELPRSPLKEVTTNRKSRSGDSVEKITDKFVIVTLEEKVPVPESPKPPSKDEQPPKQPPSPTPEIQEEETPKPEIHEDEVSDQDPEPQWEPQPEPESELDLTDTSLLSSFASSVPNLRILTWDDVCPFSDTITKIAEASYAEVYRITNSKGTSIIKVIRLQSSIKPQTKAQVASGLVDEEPHSEDDLSGEIKISEFLADIPGFVVYKERYIVQGKGTKALLETHQAFQRRMKRKDPGRAQFYPSPSRYLEETRFLVVELGDAGVALEDWRLERVEEVWDVFLLTAVALARAEELVGFEHRDLHEGNLCIRRTRPPTAKPDDSICQFGYSGLDITILDYGLSRAEDYSSTTPEPIAYDLEKDLSLFTSTHAPQCRVYRQMRSFMLTGTRVFLPPKAHNVPYSKGLDGSAIDWKGYCPYTNVLWLAYIYSYLVDKFKGDKRALAGFKRETEEMWMHLNPESPEDVQAFADAADVVAFGVEAGWIRPEQLDGDADGSLGEIEEGVASLMLREVERESIVEAVTDSDMHLRRSPRRTRRIR